MLLDAFHQKKLGFASFHLTATEGIQIEMKDSPQKPSHPFICVYNNVNGGLLPQNGEKKLLKTGSNPICTLRID